LAIWFFVDKDAVTRVGEGQKTQVTNAQTSQRYMSGIAAIFTEIAFLEPRSAAARGW
jgi:hypothetical protein